MDLLKFDEKQVRLKDIYGHTFEGVADYYDSCYSFHEYDVDEDMVRIGDWLIWESQIASIEEIVVHGTAELRTEHLKLRRYREEDAAELYEYFGTDPTTYQYSGWNPYATPELTRKTVDRFIQSYRDEHFYGWVMDVDDVIVGTIGAYDFKDGCIEVGFTVNRGWRRRGFAAEALQRVLTYLTENEGILRVTAWCASENAGSRKAMEKAGMKLVCEEKGGLTVGDRTYDRLDFEYRKKQQGEVRQVAWTVRRIMEDDYGCEERTEEEMDQVCVLLENEKGESISLKAADSLLRRMGIDEGSTWPWELPAAGSIREGS